MTKPCRPSGRSGKHGGLGNLSGSFQGDRKLHQCIRKLKVALPEFGVSGLTTWMTENLCVIYGASMEMARMQEPVA